MTEEEYFEAYPKVREVIEEVTSKVKEIFDGIMEGDLRKKVYKEGNTDIMIMYVPVSNLFFQQAMRKIDSFDEWFLDIYDDVNGAANTFIVTLSFV